MTNTSITSYKGRPCRSEEMMVGNTLFTVISVQSDQAKETAYDKVKKLILSHSEEPGQKHSIIRN